MFSTNPLSFLSYNLFNVNCGRKRGKMPFGKNTMQMNIGVLPWLNGVYLFFAQLKIVKSQLHYEFLLPFQIYHAFEYIHDQSLSIFHYLWLTELDGVLWPTTVTPCIDYSIRGCLPTTAHSKVPTVRIDKTRGIST